MEAWETILKKQAKKVMGGTGWSVGPTKKRMVQLQFRQPAGRGEKHPSTTVVLPYRWTEDTADDVVARCRAIQSLMAKDQLALRDAAQAASGASTHTVEDWGQAIDRFEAHKRNSGKVAIGDRTWRQKYEPFLRRMVMLVRQPAGPTTGDELLEAVAERWEPGSTMRGQAVRAVSSFLEFAVDRLKFRSTWKRTRPTKDLISSKKGGAKKRIGYPLTDAEVVRIVEGLVDEPELQFTVQLMATYGLRPEDVRYLKIKGDTLWSDYQKPGGGGITEERQLFPLLVAGPNGPVNWNLLERFRQGEQIFGLRAPGYAGNAIGNALRYRSIWKTIKAEVAAKGQELVPYSFRHRYVKAGQLRGIPPKTLADALGHTLESHLRAYSKWSDTESMASFFD